MKSKEARDAIISVIDNQLKEGLTKPVHVSAQKTIFDTLSGMLEMPLSLEVQLYLYERKKVLEV